MRSESDLISELKLITNELGGKMEKAGTLNSLGRSSDKITIEYNVKNKEE
jgi:hypothetical protein|tara:strand:- start:285 stop:434 length:150 start_codon:yes stop_codon:yes gene_type:complete